MQYIIAAFSVSPYVKAYEWNDPGFGTAISHPGLEIAGSLDGCKFNYNVETVVFTTGGGSIIPASKIYAYPFYSDGTFGVKYADPSVAHTYTTLGNFSPDGSVYFYGVYPSSKTIRAYPFDKVTGWGVPYAQPSSLPGFTTIYTAAPNNAGNVIATAGYYNPATTDGDKLMAIYKWDNSTGFGTKFSNPAVSTTIRMNNIVFAPNDTHVVLDSENAPYARTYEWDNDTGFGPAITTPSIYSSGYYESTIKYNPSGNVMFSNDSSYVVAYPWDPITGYGTKYTQPSISSGSVYTSEISPTGNSFVVSTGGTYKWSYFPWDDVTGWGVGTRSALTTIWPSATYGIEIIDDGFYVDWGSMRVNIYDTWHDIENIKVNIYGEWKDVESIKMNEYGSWKDLA